jgi:hypothetical protein
VVSFPPVSPPRPYTHPSPHPYVPHAQPISFSHITSMTNTYCCEYSIKTPDDGR